LIPKAATSTRTRTVFQAASGADVLRNQRLKVILTTVGSPEEFAALSPEVQLKVRDALDANLDLIESFTDENPANLSDDELDIVRSWRHLVTGKFDVYRDLKKYTVFLSTTSPAVAYGVLAWSQPFEDLIWSVSASASADADDPAAFQGHDHHRQGRPGD
jgi:hypothetical protein